jgi:hypothetical protein
VKEWEACIFIEHIRDGFVLDASRFVSGYAFRRTATLLYELRLQEVRLQALRLEQLS